MPGTSLALPVADKLSVWPVEGGKFGLDATFAGSSGRDRAKQHERALKRARAKYRFGPDASGTWTIRLGPLDPSDVRNAISAFLSAGI